MSAQHADQGGLSRAHLRLVRLLDDLNSTVESVNDLTAHGDPDKALRIVDDQRDELARIIDRIAADVCLTPQPLVHRVRRHAVLLVAAALVAVSGIAVSVGLGGEDTTTELRNPTTPTSGASNPTGNREVVSRLAGSTSEAPDVQAPVVSSGRHGDGGEGVTPLNPAIPTDPGDGGKGLVQEAEIVAEDAGNGRPPAAPQSSGDRPLNLLNGTVRTDPAYGAAG